MFHFTVNYGWLPVRSVRITLLDNGEEVVEIDLGWPPPPRSDGKAVHRAEEVWKPY